MQYPRRRQRPGCSKLTVAFGIFFAVVVTLSSLLQLQVLSFTATTSTVITQQALMSPKRKTRILFVHIGKTGGEYIKAQLAVLCKTRKNKLLKEECLGKFQQQIHPQSLISQHTFGYLHVHNPIFPKNGLKASTHYLFSVRHPLTRFLSWYTYNHPQSCDPRESNSPSCKHNDWKTLFFNCFPSVPRMVQLLVSNDSDPLDTAADQACRTIFWNGWEGRNIDNNLKYPNHLYWNYQFYWNETMAKTPHKSVLVVRQESLAQDLHALEGYLERQQQLVQHQQQQDHHQQQSLSLYPLDSFHFITGNIKAKLDNPKQQKALCCVLFPDEWAIYVTLVQRAENLSLSDKTQSLIEAWEFCGVDYDSKSANRGDLETYQRNDWKQKFVELTCA
jgi:hypothetical protein